jgi:hypothetical protein
MFDELEKYKTKGHFFFTLTDKLSEKSKDVPNLPGVYYILRLARGHVDLVYIGKSGTISQKGNFKDQLLKLRLNNKQNGKPREQFFKDKIQEEEIDALDIYWFVTFDEKHHDLPAYVEAQIIQRYFEIYGQLPEWNKEF